MSEDESTRASRRRSAGRGRTGRLRALANRRSAVRALPWVATLLIGSFLGWLLFANHGSGPGNQQSKTTSANYPALGLKLLKPPNWQAAVKRGVIELSSSDQAASVALSAPAGAGQTGPLSRSDRRQLLRLFRPARVVGHGSGTIGGRPVQTSEIIGLTARHFIVRILSTAVSSPYRTYSVQVFSTLRPSAAHLQEIRSVLDSIQFFAPKG